VLSAFPVRGAAGAPRIQVKAKVARFAALDATRLFVLHDVVMAQSAVASVVDVKDPQAAAEKQQGLNPSPAGFWTLVPDGSKVLYVKGGGVYMTTLP
jgi:hypothetical protein